MTIELYAKFRIVKTCNRVFMKALLVLRVAAAAVLLPWYDKSRKTLVLKYTRVGRKSQERWH